MALSLLGAEFEADPQRVYAGLRAEGPVLPVEAPGGLRAWLITRHDEARAALSDPRLVKNSPRRWELYSGGLFPPELRAAVGSHVLNADPPDHTRLRRLVTKAFTTRRVEALRPRVEQIVTELLDALPADGPVNLLDGLAFPLPMRVIYELIGVPDEDRERFRGWATTIVSGPAAGAELPDAAGAMVGYLRTLIDRKRVAPTDDLLTGLIAARDGESRLGAEELTSMVFLLLIAGYDTTANLIGNGAYLLATHQEQFAALRANLDLLPRAVEEILRYEGSIGCATFRLTSEPVKIGGVVLDRDQVVLVCLLAANRDQARYAEPDRFDITRGESGHLAFGHGVHSCFGAPLARLQGRIALGELARRYSGIALADVPEPLTWRPGLLMHGLRTLPLVLTPAGR